KTVLLGGVQAGVSTGLLVGLLMLIFVPTQNILLLFLVALLIGIAINVVFQAIGYALSQGKRDFTSVTQTVATKYEVLCEHKVAARARELLQQMPGARAAAFESSVGSRDPRRSPLPGRSRRGGDRRSVEH